MQTTNPLPGTSRQGAHTSLSTGGDIPRWTDRDLVLAWQLGVDYARSGETFLAAYDDAGNANISPPRLSHEERVAQRILEMEANAERFHAKHGTKPWVVAE